jgi:hypothetical protein
MWCLCSLTISAQNRYHVNQLRGNDSNDGKTWITAFATLQKALENADSGDEIWVAGGIYLPTQRIPETDNEGKPTSDRYKTFGIFNGLKLYGGFPANAADNTGMDKRDWEVHRTILSGDLNKDDGPNFTRMGDNVYNVVFIADADESTVLDGFTISGGNDDRPVPPMRMNVFKGSGICANSIGSSVSSPTIQNLIIEGNVSTYMGAGFSNESATDACPVISNTIIRGNKSGDYGGGFANFARKKSAPVLENVIISGNEAYMGGGLWCMSDEETSPVLSNVLVCGNYAERQAGGIYFRSYGNIKPILTNVTVSGNKAGNVVGGFLCYSNVFGVTSFPTLRNTVIAGNKALNMDEGYDFYNEDTGTSQYDIQNCFIGDLLPVPPQLSKLFVTPIDANLAPNSAGNYRPDKSGPLVNKGNNEFVTASVDLAGKPRIYENTVDIGAYECQELAIVGISELVTEKKVWTVAGNLYVSIDKPSMVRIYSVDGILVQQINMGEGTNAIALPSGFYIILVNNEKAVKVYVSNF